MCEILHIAQYQRWMGLKQTAVWYVLLVRRRGAPSLILWCSHLLCLCLIPPPWLFETIGSSCELVKTLWNVAKEVAWPANGFNRASGNAPQKLLVEEYKMRCRNSAAATTHKQRFNLSQRLQWQIDASWERHTSRFHSITLNTRCISDLQSCRKCFKHDSLTSKQIFKVYVLSSLEYLDF